MFMWGGGGGMCVFGKDGKTMSVKCPMGMGKIFPNRAGIPLYLKPSLNYSFAQIESYCMIIIE